jgi:23S rRNA U2552 (ribose-2'-O)-methylase RlmE/FtsJ
VNWLGAIKLELISWGELIEELDFFVDLGYAKIAWGQPSHQEVSKQSGVYDRDPVIPQNAVVKLSP